VKFVPKSTGFIVFFANGIIIFSTATLHAVGFKAENPRVWCRATVLFSFYRSFLIPQMKYSVKLLQSRFLSCFIDFCVVKETVDGTLKAWPEFVEGPFGARLGARRGGARHSQQGHGRSGGVQS
jgi:hypothetical protein